MCIGFWRPGLESFGGLVNRLAAVAGAQLICRPPMPNKTLLEMISGADDRAALVAPEKPNLTYRQLRENIRSLAAQLNSATNVRIALR
jgi:hypothetical protein